MGRLDYAIAAAVFASLLFQVFSYEGFGPSSWTSYTLLDIFIFLFALLMAIRYIPVLYPIHAWMNQVVYYKSGWHFGVIIVEPPTRTERDKARATLKTFDTKVALWRDEKDPLVRRRLLDQFIAEMEAVSRTERMWRRGDAQKVASLVEIIRPSFEADWRQYGRLAWTIAKSINREVTSELAKLEESVEEVWNDCKRRGETSHRDLVAIVGLEFLLKNAEENFQLIREAVAYPNEWAVGAFEDCVRDLTRYSRNNALIKTKEIMGWEPFKGIDGYLIGLMRENSTNKETFERASQLRSFFGKEFSP